MAIPDKRKGEQLILVTTHEKAEKADLSAYASEHGISELAVPKTIIHIEKMFVLGSGKTDYTSVMEHVLETVWGRIN